MPVYKYKCANNHEFEMFYNLSNVPEEMPCFGEQSCQETARKVPCTTAFQLKGGGWHADGYQKKGKS